MVHQAPGLTTLLPSTPVTLRTLGGRDCYCSLSGEMGLTYVSSSAAVTQFGVTG